MRKSMLSSVLLGLLSILAVACGDADAGFFDEDLDPGEVLADDQGGDEEAGDQGGDEEAGDQGGDEEAGGQGGDEEGGGQGANSDPVLQGVTLNPFNLCTNETGTLRAEAVDAEGDPITHDWRVADAPATAGMDYYAIAAGPVTGTASFSTTVPGEYEIELLLSDGRGGEAFGRYVIAVANCGAPGSVHGTKWQDDNGNGSWDAGEPGLAGVEIYMDLNANAVKDPGEPSTMTIADDGNTAFDESGMYSFEGLAPRDYIVRESVPAQAVQTFPGPDDATGATGFAVTTPGRIDLDLEAGETRVLSVSFTFEPLCFVPFKSIVTAPGAPAGVVRNLTGVVGNSCGGDSSTFDIELTADGSPHAFDLVFIDQDSAFVIATLPVRISASLDGAHAILLSPGAAVEGIDFGNQPILPGSVHGATWRDDNGDGVRDNDEPGLAGVTIYVDLDEDGELDEREPRTTTIADDPLTRFDERGLYWIEGLKPGAYVVREVVPQNFVQTFPRRAAHAVEVGSGEAVEGLDFGNQSSL